MYLVWFVYNVLWSRDVNNNISLSLINLSEDLEAFNSYSWGYESFKMPIEYLLTPLTPKTVNLYGFPWAFKAWAFEAIPYLKQEVNYQEEVSCPRILRWLSAKTNKNILPHLANVLHANVKTCARATDEQNELKKVDVTATVEEHNMTVDNPSNTSKDEEKVEPVRTDWSTIEVYRDKRANPFDVQYVKAIGSLDCGPFVAAYAEYLSYGLQVPNDGLDTRLLRKLYASLLWKYGEAKAQKPYATNVKNPRRPKSNSIALDEEQLVHID
ncbi:hypothetical protein BC332_21867 [Capsicum chinense]|nr:hypothetical protein BC332_21867 [Capsicum chinense]